jgi:hypothetical protein
MLHARYSLAVPLVCPPLDDPVNNTKQQSENRSLDFGFLKFEGVGVGGER